MTAHPWRKDHPWQWSVGKNDRQQIHVPMALPRSVQPLQKLCWKRPAGCVQYLTRPDNFFILFHFQMNSCENTHLRALKLKKLRFFPVSNDEGNRLSVDQTKNTRGGGAGGFRGR
jgi:hypothetical protein